MILILSEESDIHSLTVLRKIVDNGGTAQIIDTSRFPEKLFLELSYRDENFTFSLSNGDTIIKSDEVTGVWIRRLQFPDIPKEVENDEMRKFSFMQSKEVLFGWLCCFKNTINSLAAEFSATKKVYQLKIAQSLGLRIPKTIITNNSESVKEFCRSLNTEIIYKPLYAPHFTMAPTQILGESDLAMLENLKYGPSIFQERITALKHLRITIVDDNVFVAEIEPFHERATLDWRVSSDYKIKQDDIPLSEKIKLIKLHKQLGLRYGAVDMILDINGKYVFLETNPGGQYLFCEIHAGLEISNSIAKSLLQSEIAA